MTVANVIILCWLQREQRKFSQCSMQNVENLHHRLVNWYDGMTICASWELLEGREASAHADRIARTNPEGGCSVVQAHIYSSEFTTGVLEQPEEDSSSPSDN